MADHLIARHWHFLFDTDQIEEHQNGMVEAAEIVAQAKILVADNVSKYVHHRGMSTIHDMPSLAPPWPSFWIEYGIPDSRERFGVIVSDVTDHADGSYLASMAAKARADVKAPQDEIRWVVSFHLFATKGKTVWGPVAIVCVALDESGHPIGDEGSASPLTAIVEWSNEQRESEDADLKRREVESAASLSGFAAYGDYGWAGIPDLDEIRAMPPERFAALREYTRTHKDVMERRLKFLNETVDTKRRHLAQLNDALDTVTRVPGVGYHPDLGEAPSNMEEAFAPAFQTVAFLHCKNVEVEEQIPDDKLQAKRRRQGRQPLLRYHTVRLDVPRRQTTGTDGNTGIEHALHIVAGHFAHYGDCCPTVHEPNGLMFGRLSGVYWVPSHVRGDPSIGEVITDFDVHVSGP